MSSDEAGTPRYVLQQRTWVHVSFVRVWCLRFEDECLLLFSHSPINYSGRNIDILLRAELPDCLLGPWCLDRHSGYPCCPSPCGPVGI